MSHPTPSTTPSRTPSRRALLGAAAWSVPVITIAAAAPAFAQTVTAWSTQLQVKAATATITAGSNSTQTIEGRVEIYNPAATATSGLQVIFTIPLAYHPTSVTAFSLGSGLGTWDATEPRSDGTQFFTVTLTPRKQLDARSSTTITFKVTAVMPGLTGVAPAVSVSTVTPVKWVSFEPTAA